uniref:hypothetical protein n=1 Tax=Mycoplasmopsis bovis TaxID=28903 RepID=UPI003D2E10EA
SAIIVVLIKMLFSFILLTNNNAINPIAAPRLNKPKRIFKYCNDSAWPNNSCVGGYFNLNKLSNQIFKDRLQLYLVGILSSVIWLLSLFKLKYP